MITADAASPMPLMACMPKRILPSLSTLKSMSESLTLGAATSTPCFLQSSMSSRTRLMSACAEVITAAIYSAG